MSRSDNHSCVRVGQRLIQTCPLHSIPDTVDRLFDVELGSHQPPLLLPHVVQLLTDLLLQIQLVSQSGDLGVDTWVLQSSQRIVRCASVWGLFCEVLGLCVCDWAGQLEGVWRVGSEWGGIWRSS